jgi:hypothetical protein
MSSQAKTKRVVVMRRYLVVANQTLQRAELADELRKRFEAGPSSFYLLVPDTRAADYPAWPRRLVSCSPA